MLEDFNSYKDIVSFILSILCGGVVIKNWNKSVVVVKNFIKNINERNKIVKDKKSNRKEGVKQPLKEKCWNNGTIKLVKVLLYSTGARGKVFTKKFYKRINHNFGIELVIRNDSNKRQSISVKWSIYDVTNQRDVIADNSVIKIAAREKLIHDIYVSDKEFVKLPTGEYESRFCINGKQAPKMNFYILEK